MSQLTADRLHSELTTQSQRWRPQQTRTEYPHVFLHVALTEEKKVGTNSSHLGATLCLAPRRSSTMDLFIANLDTKLSKGKLQESLTPVLSQFDIHVFDVQKALGKGFASLIIPDPLKAQRLLAAAKQNHSLLCSPSGRPAIFQVSRRPIDKFRLKAVAYEDKSRKSRNGWKKSASDASEVSGDVPGGMLNIDSIQCGYWETKDGGLAFQPCFQISSLGCLKLSSHAIAIVLDDIEGKAYELTMEHTSIQSLAIGKQGSKDMLTITLIVSPKIIGDEHTFDAQQALLQLMAGLTVSPKHASKVRLSSLPGHDPLVAGSCLTYSVVFSGHSPARLQRLRHLVPCQIPLHDLPPIATRKLPLSSYKTQIWNLDLMIAQLKCSFPLKFQLQALWANGILAPSEIAQVLPTCQSCATSKVKRHY
jgi:hypothetical protein